MSAVSVSLSPPQSTMYVRPSLCSRMHCPCPTSSTVIRVLSSIGSAQDARSARHSPSVPQQSRTPGRRFRLRRNTSSSTYTATSQMVM